MKIEYRKGDLFAAPEKVIVHGCNAKGKMGSGVAAIVRRLFPGAYDAYMKRHRDAGLKVGTVVWAVVDDKVIANAITQYDYGGGAKHGLVYVDYRAVAACMGAINTAAVGLEKDEFGQPIRAFDAVAMPLIGAGLAGGDWTRLASIIESELTEVRPVVYVPTGRLPDGTVVG